MAGERALGVPSLNSALTLCPRYSPTERSIGFDVLRADLSDYAQRDLRFRGHFDSLVLLRSELKQCSTLSLCSMCSLAE